MKHVARVALKNVPVVGGLVDDLLVGTAEAWSKAGESSEIQDLIATLDKQFGGIADQIEKLAKDEAHTETLFENNRAKFEKKFLAVESYAIAHREALERVCDLIREEHDKTRKAVEDAGRNVSDRVEHVGEDVKELKILVLQLAQNKSRHGVRSTLSQRTSMSIRTDAERTAVRKLLERYRALPEESQMNFDITNDLGMLLTAAEDFSAAKAMQEKSLAIAKSSGEKGIASFNQYQRCIRAESYDDALSHYLDSILHDSAHELFPSNKYRPSSILGAGGFGVTFKCDQFGVDVAVKSLCLEEGADVNNEIERIAKEWQALQSVRSDRVIRPLDFGSWGSKDAPKLYLAMNYFGGLDLESHLLKKRNGKPFEIERALAISKEIALGLKAAHKRNLLHRDIKPANILYREDQGEFEIRIIDFGLAMQQKRLEEEKRSMRGSSSRTRFEESIAGTLKYSAPEQLGDLPGVPVKEYSDIYAWARTTYFLMFGAPDIGMREIRSLPDDVAELLDDCSRRLPSERPANFDIVIGNLDRILECDQEQSVLPRISVGADVPSSDSSPSLKEMAAVKNQESPEEIDPGAEWTRIYREYKIIDRLNESDWKRRATKFVQLSGIALEAMDLCDRFPGHQASREAARESPWLDWEETASSALSDVRSELKSEIDAELERNPSNLAELGEWTSSLKELSGSCELCQFEGGLAVVKSALDSVEERRAVINASDYFEKRDYELALKEAERALSLNAMNSSASKLSNDAKERIEEVTELRRRIAELRETTNYEELQENIVSLLLLANDENAKKLQTEIPGLIRERDFSNALARVKNTLSQGDYKFALSLCRDVASSFPDKGLLLKESMESSIELRYKQVVDGARSEFQSLNFDVAHDLLKSLESEIPERIEQIQNIVEKVRDGKYKTLLKKVHEKHDKKNPAESVVKYIEIVREFPERQGEISPKIEKAISCDMWDAFLALPENQRASFLDLQVTQRSVFLALPANQRAAFLDLPANQRSAFLGLPETQRSAFLDLPANQRSAFLGLPANQRAACAALPVNQRSAFLGLPANQRVAFLDLPENQRTAFLGLPENHRSAFLGLPANQRAAFLDLPANQRSAFLALPANQRSAFLAFPANKRSAFLDLPEIQRSAFLALSANQRAAFLDTSPEGRYWMLAKELRTLTGHTGWVYSASFSPDGKFIVTASSDNTAKIWDANTGRELRTLTGHTSTAWSASFSPDGKFIVTGSSVNTAKIWDANTGIELRTLTGHTGQVRSASFSPDGKFIVTASSDNTAKIWDANTGSQIRTLTGHTNWVRSASFSPDGKSIVTGSWDNTAKIWDAETGREIRTLTGHTSYVYSASFSPDGKFVVTGSSDKIAKIWDANTGREIRTLTGHTNPVNSASFSPDGKSVVTGSDDNLAKIWGLD
ncbi:MAG: protein kinase [Planctomycetes bacterium]|nr:protein kinase [Planctomycetota bacterium]